VTHCQSQEISGENFQGDALSKSGKQPFTNYYDDYIKKIQLKINQRSRKNLNFDEPIHRVNGQIKKPVACVT
jgi:hypothetical protein